jgi:MFS family permease
MRRLFLLVSAVVLVDTMFFAAVAPLLPHYSHELHLTKTAAGVLTAAYPAGTFAGSLPGGWLAARWGVKPTLLAGLSLLATTSLVFAFANSIVLLDSARFVQGVGGAFMWAAGMAWLVSAAPAERRGEMIGSALGAAIVGVLFGPVLGGAATVIGDEPVFGFVSALAIGLACWAWTIPGVPPEASPGWGVVARALGRRDLLAGFWLFTLPAIFAGVLEVLVPLRLDRLGASGAAVGAIFLVAAAFEAVVSPIAGRVSDRRGRMTPIRAGLAGAVAMAVLMPLPQLVVLVAAALVVTVCALGGFWAPGMALLSDASERAGLDQALAFSIANLAWALGHVTGGGAGGALADATADGVVYGLLGAACAVTLVGVVAVSRSSARAPSRSGGTA